MRITVFLQFISNRQQHCTMGKCVTKPYSVKLILAAMYNLYSIPGFENPGHAGHMCPVTFEIRQPHLAGPKSSQIRISGLQAKPAIFLKKLALPQAQAAISVYLFYHHLAGCKQANRSILSQTYKKLFSKPAKYYISKMIGPDIKKKLVSKEQSNWL